MVTAQAIVVILLRLHPQARVMSTGYIMYSRLSSGSHSAPCWWDDQNSCPGLELWPNERYHLFFTHLCTFTHTHKHTRGVAIGGSRGSDEPPRAGKGPQKSVFSFSFLFFFWAGSHAQESVFIEKDERTPPTEYKSCKTRHGQVNIRMALSPNAVAAKDNQP